MLKKIGSFVDSAKASLENRRSRGELPREEDDDDHEAGVSNCTSAISGSKDPDTFLGKLKLWHRKKATRRVHWLDDYGQPGMCFQCSCANGLPNGDSSFDNTATVRIGGRS